MVRKSGSLEVDVRWLRFGGYEVQGLRFGGSKADVGRLRCCGLEVLRFGGPKGLEF